MGAVLGGARDIEVGAMTSLTANINVSKCVLRPNRGFVWTMGLLHVRV